MGESRPDSFIHPALYLEDIPQDVLAMYVEYLEGATITQVAQRHGRDPGRVGELFAECGLEKRTGSLQPPLPPRRPTEPVIPPQEVPSPAQRRREREQAKNERRKAERRIRREERNRK